MRTSHMNFNEKFSKYIGIMKEAFERKDFDTYDSAKSLLDEAVEECREIVMLTNESKTSNFGLLNYIIEESLPELFKNNQQTVAKIMKTIKEDKNLSSQFKFYHALKNFHGDNALAFVKESLELVNEDINKTSVRKSGSKLSKIMLENNIIPTRLIDKNTRTFYENCDYLLTKKKRITNLTEMEDKTKAVGEYIATHVKSINEAKKTTLQMIDEYEKTLQESLTNEERSLVQDIIDFKTPGINERKEKMFNQLKNECLNKVDEMLSENANGTKLNMLKNQLNEKQFCEDSIVKDIAKLLEIRDILYED